MPNLINIIVAARRGDTKLLQSILIITCAALVHGQSAVAVAEEAPPTSITIAIPNISPPFVASSQANMALRVTSNVFDPLIFRDPQTGELRPGIATKWEQISSNELVLEIRTDVTFHDGSPLTAEDVAFTLSPERLNGADAIEPSALASTITNVEVIDDRSVKITTNQPDPALLNRLASQIGFVVPKRVIKAVGIAQFGLHPIGTGPYKVTQIAPGEKVDLAANEQYWGGTPPFHQISFLEVPEVSARVAGLATGEYSVASNIPPDQIGQIEANGQQIASVQVNNIVSLAFMTAKQGSPIADARIRRAIAYAVDREAINQALWHGLVGVPDGFNLPVYNDFFDSRRRPLAYNPDQAKALLQEAGYKGEPIVLRYILGLYTNFDRALEVMLSYWSDVGLNVKLQGVASFTLLDYPTLDIYATSSNILLSDPITPLWTDWVSPGSVYISKGRGVLSSELSASVERLATSLEVAERKDAYAASLIAWDAELPALGIWQPVDIFGVGEGVTLKPDPRYWMRFAPIPGE